MVQFCSDSSRASPEGTPVAVLAAKTSGDVAAGLRWASAHQLPVSVRGAGTGLAGGAVSYPGGLVISLADMNDIIGIDPENRLAKVQAGVITAAVDAAAAEHGLMYAPDPASYRQSTIGGNIATNAGGLRCVKYGVTTDSVAALEVVLPNGDVIRTGAETRKNVVGYDLTSLFVGSEGTLGIITAATLRLLPRPSGRPFTFRAAFSSNAAAGRAVTALMNSPLEPEVLELMDRSSVELVEKFHPTGLAFRGEALLIGQFISDSSTAEAAAAAEICREAGASAVDQAEGNILLEARRVSGPALDAQGLRASCDVAVPVDRLADMFEALQEISNREGVSIPTFAHAGDGNLHPSVLMPEPSTEALSEAERVLGLITDRALALGGTISGEHGVGSLKHKLLPKQLDDATRAAHQLVKNAFDPHGLLTPGRGI